jgi:catechol 2,3-dioxygenase-like lactoylglutathione lyase family enzyme
LKKIVKKASAKRTGETGGRNRADVPELFRLNVEVGDIDAAAAFYGELLGAAGRVQAGARVLLPLRGGDVAGRRHLVRGNAAPGGEGAVLHGARPRRGLRAREEARLPVEGDPSTARRAARVSVRPWGERSFYAQDPWSNPLCFVEAGTIYAG